MKAFHALSSAQRIALYLKAGNERRCDSCRFWVPVGKEMDCWQHMPACKADDFRVCDFYEREAGAD